MRTFYWYYYDVEKLITEGRSSWMAAGEPSVLGNEPGTRGRGVRPIWTRG